MCMNAVEVTAYETAVYSSWIASELKACRNSHASFHSPLGLMGGMVHTALSSFITKGAEPWTLTYVDTICTLPCCVCVDTVQRPVM